MISLENSLDKIIFDNKTFIMLSKDLGQSKATLNTSKTIGQNGVFLNNSFLEGRDISIKGAIMGRGTTIETAKKKLTNLVNPLIPLILTVDGKKIECTATGSLKVDNSKARYDYCEFLIELFCPNPFFDDEDGNIVDLSYWIDNFSFELEIPSDGIEFGYKNEESITNLYNESSVETGMLITIQANTATSNPSILNIYTREYIKINKTMAVGEVITINTNYGKKRIESNINGVTTNILHLMDIDSTFLQLHTGDNWLKLEADNGTDGLVCKIEYADKYLGV